jgi:deoxyribodipyrimidine photo-lyase
MSYHQARKLSLPSTHRAIAFLLVTFTIISLFTESINKDRASNFFASTLALTTSTPMASKATTIGATNNINTLYIHWFRHGDLRLHDNPALIHTIKAANKGKNISLSDYHRILPIFFFDPRFLGGVNNKTPFGTNKCGPRRAKFLIESVANLRENLAQQGSGLVVSLGKPEEFFESLIKLRERPLTLKVTCQEEVASEEIQVVKSVEKILEKSQVPSSSSVTQVWGSTLYNLQHLPFDESLKEMPDTFTPFRNKVEKHCAIEKPLPPPSKNQLHSTICVSELESIICQDKCSLHYLPTLEDLGYSPNDTEELEEDPRGVMSFKGGESAALARVQEYIWNKDLLKKYFDTRNGMLGPDYSSKFSPWLAHGCLSPRYVADQCFKYESQRVANKSTYWLVFELLWRDFFKFLALKHGNSIFFLNGTIGSTSYRRPWRYDPKYFEAWREGQTGYPLVDANMRELKATGFMSNRGRQNVCSFLAIDMNMDWRYGAYYFEQELLDYDVYSNWGNWASGAGVMGGRLNRFNIVKQSKDYDFDGDYVRHWLPELGKVPSSLIHEPWKMSSSEQEMYGVKLGVDYPHPIVRPSLPFSRGDAKSIGGRLNSSQNAQKDNGRKGGKKEMKSLPKGSYKFS